MANQPLPATDNDIEIKRIPFLGTPGTRGMAVAGAIDASKDQRFVNCYFWRLKNPVTNAEVFFLVKRPGLSQNVQPSGTTGAGRGIYSWKSNLYAVIGTKIYKGTTDLGVTLRTSSGLVGIAETRAGAATPYLGVNDGTDLYLIATDGSVIVLNNVAITSSSVASPTVITATAHGLSTGNKIIIRGHTGSTPDINGTIYTITKTGTDTFTIPVNVTIGGTGGTIGVFPTPNTTDLHMIDGYWVTMKSSDATHHHCDLDDPTTWDPTKFLAAQMYSGTGVGLAHQNNFLMMFMEKSIQFFFDNANSTGSVFTNYESAVKQVGCASQNSISQYEDTVTWVGKSLTGGYTVWVLDGTTELEEIATTTIKLMLDAEITSIASCRGKIIRDIGKKLYILTLTNSNRTFVYDYELKIWTEYQGAGVTTRWPIIAFAEHANGLLAQHETNGWVYNVSSLIFQDDSTNFTVLARFGRVDFDTNRRKFVKSYELIGDKQTSTTNVTFQYSDDDYITLSTAYTFDMSSTRPYKSRGGSFRRRAHQISFTGNNPLRLESLEIRYRLGDT